MTRDEWRSAEKKIDPDFKGSIFERMGLSELLCPRCNAHLKGTSDPICLNACHLGTLGAEGFSEAMSQALAAARGEK